MSPKIRLLCEKTMEICLIILVGATRQDPKDICYLYENDENFSLFPIYYVTFGPAICMNSSLVPDAMPHFQMDPTNVILTFL